MHVVVHIVGHRLFMGIKA